jgi:hypothetical protein
MDPATWVETVEGWHDFFLMAGTAAVTLAGLLFVALSIHVDSLVQAKREHLLDLSRVTLLSFVMVLVLSLSMLMPHLSQKFVGVQLLVFSGVFSAITLWTMIAAKGEGHEHYTLARFRRRLAIPVLGYVYIGAVGWLLRHKGGPASLNFLLGGIGLLLGNASGTSWELLVRVARIRKSDAEEAARGAPLA